MAFTLQELHDEIENDPEALGYKEVGGEWKGDRVIADIINAKNFIIDRENIPTGQVRATTTYDAYNDLSIDEQEWIRWMTPGSGDEFGDGGFQVTADMKLQLTGRSLAVNGVAGSGNNNASFWSVAERGEMAPAMLALIEISGSRAGVLWDEGASVSAGQVGAAANL